MKEEIKDSMRERQRAFLRDAQRETNRRGIAHVRLGGIDAESVGRLRLSHLKDYADESLVAHIVEWLKAPPQSFAQSLADLKASDEHQLHRGVISLRKLLTTAAAEHIQPIIDSGALPALVALAQRGDRPHLQLEASWCLANLLSGTTAQTAFLVRKNLVGVLLEVAQSPFPQVAEQAIWAAGNLAADCLEFRQMLVQAKAVPILCAAFDAGEQYLQTFIVWALANICKNAPGKEPNSVIDAALSRLVQFVAAGRATTAEDLFNCLSALAERLNKHNADVAANAAFVAQLRGCYATMVNGQNPELLSLIHQIFGALTSGPNEHADGLMDDALFASFRALLVGAATTAAKKELCWVLANIALCESRHALFLIAAPGVLDAAVALVFDADDEMAREALYVVCNLTKSGETAVLKQLFDRGLLSIYERVLRECVDVRVTLVLESLFQVLKSGAVAELPRRLVEAGVADLVERHQRSENDLVYFKARVILETFFVIE